MSNILLLGGGGFIGSNLAHRLKHNHKITIFDLDFNNTFPEEIRTIKGDLRDSQQLEDIFRNDPSIDTVVYLISGLLPGSTYDAFINSVDLNFAAFFKLLDVMHRADVHKFIFFSSGGTVYGKNGLKVNKETDPANPINYYGWTKLITEQYLTAFASQFEIDYLILRPSNPYGMGQDINRGQGLITSVLGKLLMDMPIEIWGDGEAIRDYIYIGDLCKTVEKLLQKQLNHQILNIGSGRGFSIKEVLKIVSKVTKKDLKVVYKEARSVDIPVNVLDVSKIQSFIKYDDLIELEKGIEIYWNQLLEKSKSPILDEKQGIK